MNDKVRTIAPLSFDVALCAISLIGLLCSGKDVLSFPCARPRRFFALWRAGADSAITQYFFNLDAYLHFRDRVLAKGVNVPIVPGIMPITNYTQLARFSETCGAEIPRWVRQRLIDFGDDLESLKAFGHEVVLKLCENLISEGAPSLHFYTLNQAGPTTKLVSKIRPLIG